LLTDVPSGTVVIKPVVGYAMLADEISHMLSNPSSLLPSSLSKNMKDVEMHSVDNRRRLIDHGEAAAPFLHRWNKAARTARDSTCLVQSFRLLILWRSQAALGPILQLLYDFIQYWDIISKVVIHMFRHYVSAP
jgi:site-specific recombinase XerD